MEPYSTKFAASARRLRCEGRNTCHRAAFQGVGILGETHPTAAS